MPEAGVDTFRLASRSPRPQDDTIRVGRLFTSSTESSNCHAMSVAEVLSFTALHPALHPAPHGLFYTANKPTDT
jgi:hypothetical protein